MENSSNQNYWSLIWERFKKNRSARWSFKILLGLFWIALLDPFIAGDVPIFTKIDGKTSFPIFKTYLFDLGLAQKTGNYLNKSYWHEQKYDQVILPIIPYSAAYRDIKNVHFKSPFGPQNIAPNQSWHWLGTDGNGRDVAAGVIGGVRVALKVGLISMFIASIIGLFMGGLAGYFGDDRFQVYWSSLILNLIAFFLAIHFAFISRAYPLGLKDANGELLKSIGIFIGVFLIANLIAKGFQMIPLFQKKVTLPLDLIVMRIVEVLNSIPGLLLIIAFAAIFSAKTLWPIILIIGFLYWTGIARFFRAELLKVRNMEYIQAGKALGFSNWRILFKHALPNAIGPVIILVAFGTAGAILAEAALTFLGVGTKDLAEVTWGSMLRAADNPKHWWIVIFPGLAIFVTVLIFNLIGDGLKEAIDARDI